MEGEHLHGDEWRDIIIILESEEKVESGMNDSMLYTREAAQKADGSVHQCVLPSTLSACLYIKENQ